MKLTENFPTQRKGAERKTHTQFCDVFCRIERFVVRSEKRSDGNEANVRRDQDDEKE